jgi:hypothetical protein
MDHQYAPQPIAGWFKLAAIASILFMLIGCAGYVMDVTSDPASLTLDRRALVEARPIWQVAAYAIAVWVGLAGAVLLFMRRKLAEHLLLVSLIACVFTFLPYFVVPAVRDLVSTGEIAFGLIIISITWTIFWFARHSRQRSWLN